MESARSEGMMKMTEQGPTNSNEGPSSSNEEDGGPTRYGDGFADLWRDVPAVVPR